MLNIPETVKTLFKADGIRKNFRVQFPDGELPDITNENIVQESVKFTESLCSQDVLKFGLTEASVIEFETVGVANMYGMTIECGIEIDLSSLSASDLADIAAGSWDGTYVALADSDLGYAFFRVPYGVFRVESCPRDHQVMTHRQVQAYSLTQQVLRYSPFEEAKLAALLYDNPKFATSVQKLIYANLGYYYPDMMTAAGYSKTQESTFNHYEVTTLSLYVKIKGSNTTYTVDFDISISSKEYQGSSSHNHLFEFVHGDYDPTALYEGAETLDSLYDLVGAPFPYQQVNSFSELLRRLSPLCGCIMGYSSGDFVYEFTEDVPCFYPYRGGSPGRILTNTFQVVKSITITDTALRPTIPTQTFTASGTNTLRLNKYTTEATQLPVVLKPTQQSGSRVSYTDSYSLQNILNGHLELNAQFGKTDRNGKFVMARLSRSDVENVTTGEYSQLWWDEYDVQPIGSVKYSYGTGSDENIIIYQFDTGLSTYDMTDNEILKMLDGYDNSSINALLDEYFIPYLAPIAFTPIDLDMKGLPYIEAGDALSVITEDSEAADSFNMRQEISGVQVLTAAIESTSGDIIDSQEGA